LPKASAAVAFENGLYLQVLIHHSLLTIHHKYIQRCLELAKLGAGHVAPNPMVGAVLVYDDRIISEGWHKQYGGPHAEVNCILGRDAILSNSRRGGLNDNQSDLNDLIQRSTLYVSLEPCAHFGKTPPCTDLIIKHKIPKVVIGCRDPFKEVDGRGIEKLKAAGVEVELVDRLLQHECEKLNKRFFTFHKEQRPYIILKWAQTGDGFIAPPPPEGGILASDTNNSYHKFEDSKTPPSEGLGEASSSGGRGARLLISNEYSNRLVHQWRSEEATILVGTNTALLDDPELTNRLWTGPSPVRLIIDKELKLPASLKIFSRETRTIIFNTIKQEEDGNLLYYRLKNDSSLVRQVLKALYDLKLQSVLVEGGAKLLQSFIDEGLWDEARIINSEKLITNSGVAAPGLENAILCGSEQLLTDTIETYFPAEKDHKVS
jgi:diaminohydroxyphosphoribosylaminopyrimidine deaminase / 5-amino-6-(5-phosphoribosylamino)uracil reductase